MWKSKMDKNYGVAGVEKFYKFKLLRKHIEKKKKDFSKKSKWQKMFSYRFSILQPNTKKISHFPMILRRLTSITKHEPKAWKPTAKNKPILMLQPNIQKIKSFFFSEYVPHESYFLWSKWRLKHQFSQPKSWTNYSSMDKHIHVPWLTSTTKTWNYAMEAYRILPSGEFP